MKRAVAIGAAALFLLGIGAAFAVGETGTVAVCATVTSPPHTVAVDGNPVATIPGDTATNCVTSAASTSTTAPATTTTTVTGSLYADHNPATGTLAPWQNLQSGTPSCTVTDPTVADNPTGITTPGIIRITPDPLGQRGDVFELTTTPQSEFCSGSRIFDRVDLWQNNGVPWNTQGTEVWEHYSMMFPSCCYNANAVASGGWTQGFQHHSIISSSMSEGVTLSIRNTVPPRFYFRVPGGDTAAGPTYSECYAPDTIVYDHWYDIVDRIKWSTKSDGLADLWVDGNHICSFQRSTLQFNSSQVDKPNYEFSNYHNHITTNHTIYYGRLEIGSTREVVGG